MNSASMSSVLLVQWHWWLAGMLTGCWLPPLARVIPREVLQRAQASFHEWQGPGGGVGRPVPLSRRIWVPLVNAGLWAFAATRPVLWAVLPWAALASSLLLLALIDWDTTLLPDWIVMPLGVAGLLSSHAGFTGQSLFASALSSIVVLGFMGGLGWVFRRVKGSSGIGGGDLKLLAALATWCGATGVLYVVLWASVATVVWYLTWRRFKGLGNEAEWPFGPSIAAAALAWSLLGARLPGALPTAFSLFR